MENKFRLNPNSFKNTFCIFKEQPLHTIEKLPLQFESTSGSCYYYTQKGMYRLSNHWGRLANSKWRLEPLEQEIDCFVPIAIGIRNDSKTKLGFALWTDFYPDNAIEKLYYLDTNYKTNTVNYQHKNNPSYDNKAILRTSIETTKKIKQIRNLLELTSWAKHFDYTDLNLLRQKIIVELTYTDKSLEEIKREIMGAQ